MVYSPEKHEIALMLFPGVVGWNYCFYHNTMSNYEIDHIKNNTYITS